MIRTLGENNLKYSAVWDGLFSVNVLLKVHMNIWKSFRTQILLLLSVFLHLHVILALKGGGL